MLGPSKSLALLPVLLIASPATAIIVPTAPIDTNTVFRAGENCTFSFERDPTGVSVILFAPYVPLTDKVSHSFGKLSMST